jgi:peptide/nickel transport system substrate-binding protein
MRRALLLSLALGLLAGGAAADEPRRGGDLVFAVQGAPPTTDCHAGTSFAVLHYISPHYSLLVKFDPDRFPEVKGDLAEAWSASEDGLAYTFRLRPNVLFHDGTKLTSADVKASYERILAPPPGVVSAIRPLYANIAAVEAPDPATVVFRLRRPQAPLLGLLANPFACILSAAKLARDPAYPSKEVMGSGPFRFVEQVAGSHWIGRRFDNYFLPGRPYLDSFRAVTFSQGSAIANALQGGQVLAEFRGFSPAVRDRLVKEMGANARVEESVWALSMLLAFNAERPPFDDPRVRRALNIAIDRWGASAALSRTVSLRAVGATQRPGSPWAASDGELERLPGFARDMEAARAEARRLLKEAGQGGLKFTLSNRTIADPYTAVGVYLIDQWRRIGVEVEHRQLETAAWTETAAKGTFEAMIEFTNALVDDPELELVKYISRDRSELNTGRSVDRELDRIYDRLVAERDGEARRRLVRDFEARLYEQSYMMPFLWTHRIVVMNARVQGWKMTPSHLVNQDLTEIWLRP